MTSHVIQNWMQMGDWFVKKYHIILLFSLVPFMGVVTGPTSVSAQPLIGVVQKTIQWKWSDGVNSGSRSISKTKFKNAANVPTINLVIKPLNIPRIASLQWSDEDGEWWEENRGQSVGGKLSLAINPICGDTWCSGKIKYRLIIEASGNQPTYKSSVFTISFSSSSGGSSGGTSAAAFIGWNLESVQEYLGYDPSTYDCSGSYRSVWWASNWWVVSVSGTTLIVSKSQYGCS